MAEVHKNPKILAARTDLKLNSPELRLQVDRDKAADLGIGVATIGRTIETMMGGRDVTRFKMNGEQYDVIVKSEDELRVTPEDLNRIYVRSGEGAMVPLSNLVTIKEGVTAQSLKHFNRSRAAIISANLAPGYCQGEALAFLNDAAKRVLPDTARIDYQGQSREFMDSSSDLLLTFALALIMIYLMMAAQFESFVDPLIILFTVPLSMVGALLALYYTGNSLSIYSQVGLITMKRIIIVGLMLLLVSGCALGPNYQPPKAPVPIKYKNDAPWKAATPKDTHPKGRWWEIYNDPMLNQLEEQAAEANQSLQAAYARLTQAQAALGITQADRVPRIDLNARAGRELTGADLSGTANGQVDSQFNLPLILDYELDLWGRVTRSIESAQADSQSAVADYQSLLLSLQAELARTYFSIGETDAEIALLQQTIQLRREARDLVKDKYDSGHVDLLDLSRAEAELAFTQAEAVGLTRQRGELENSIAVLIGQPPSTFLLAVVALPSAPPEVIPGLPSDLLERRPDVAAAERQMVAASAQIGVAQTAFFPSIRITGSTGFASSQFGSLFNWDNRTWGLGTGAVHLPADF